MEIKQLTEDVDMTAIIALSLIVVKYNYELL